MDRGLVRRRLLSAKPGYRSEGSGCRRQAGGSRRFRVEPPYVIAPRVRTRSGCAGLCPCVGGLPVRVDAGSIRNLKSTAPSRSRLSILTTLMSTFTTLMSRDRKGAVLCERLQSASNGSAASPLRISSIRRRSAAAFPNPPHRPTSDARFRGKREPTDHGDEIVRAH